MLQDYLDRLPLVAILRGVTPDAAAPIGRALAAAGFAVFEVPLNSPQPFASIRRLRDALDPRVLVGAGTVRRAEEAAAVADAGGGVVVMPHADPAGVRP